MRSFVGKNPHLVIVWLFVLLFFFAWTGIAQDVKELDAAAGETVEAPKETAPTFEIVSPLNKDILSGKSIFIITPTADLPDLVAAVQLSSPQGNYESKFSESDHWMHAVDTTQLQDGEYSATFSLCAQGVCEKKELSVRIENKIQTTDPTGGNSGGVEPTPPATTEPSAPPIAGEPIQVIPSNHAGAFYLSNRFEQAFTFKSSGDPLKISKGIYDAKFQFFEKRVASINIFGAKLDQDGIIVQWSENAITQPLVFNEQTYEPVESYWFQFGFPAESMDIQLIPAPEYAFIWCRSWNKDQGLCTRVEVLDEEADNALVKTTEQDMVLVIAKRVDTTSTLPRYHTLVPSNHAGKFIFEQQPDGELIRTTHEVVELREGEYDVNAYFEDLPIQFVHMRSAGIDHNDILLQFPFIQRTPEGIVTLSMDEPYGFSSGFFAISQRYAEGSIWSCQLWNVAAQNCLGAWTRTYETRMQKGTMFLRFYPPGVDVNEVEIPPIIPPTGGEISDEAALLAAIAKLKDLSINSTFFKGNDALANFTILNGLFSDVEISLECDPAKLIAPPTRPIPKPVPVAPIDSIPAEIPAQDVSPSSADTPTITPDENITLNFQAEAPGIIPDAAKDDARAQRPNDADSIDPVFVEPAPIPPKGGIDSPFSSAWEDAKPARPEGSENSIECDGVALQHQFEEQYSWPEIGKINRLGDIQPQIKEILSLTNNTFIEQKRSVHVRLITKALALSSDDGVVVPSQDYAGIRTKVEVAEVPVLEIDANEVAATALPIFVERLKNYRVQLLDENAISIGSYDWKDYWDANTSPITIVHAGKQGMIIDTLIQVKISPGATRVIDPIYKLTDFPNFAAGWDGNNNQDWLGMNGDSNAGIQVVNVDNNIAANDLLITAPWADYNGKIDAGAVFLIKDFNKYTGLRSLADRNNFDLAFYGATKVDYLGRTGASTYASYGNGGSGVQLFDTDGNGYANDLLISAPNADVNTKADVGAIYYIKDIDKKTGSFSLASMDGVNVRWSGSVASDFIGYTALSGLGVKVVNLDANVVANDLVITAPSASLSKTDGGSIYVIKDINTIHGPIDVNRMRDLNHLANFNVRFDGNTASDFLGAATQGGEGVLVVNTDKNVVANDLIMIANIGDANSKTDAGLIYLVKDVNTLSGIKRFANTADFHAMWHGGTSWGLGSIGGTTANNAGGRATQILDLNGDGYFNDMLALANLGDFNGRADNGVLFLITDINSITGTFDLNSDTKTDYLAKWYGAGVTERIGYLSNTYYGIGGIYADSIQVFNIDGNQTANDLLITAPLNDFNAKTDAGVVYFIKDINSRRGNYDLNTPSNYFASWYGEAASDNTGRNNNQDQSVQVVNIDGNLYANDLIISSVMADINGSTNAGAVYLILDINAKNNRFYLGNSDTYQARWNGGAQEYLGDTNNSRQGVQLVNIDNNAWANDLIITSPGGDTNGFVDNGIVYLIRDINRNYGATLALRTFDLASTLPERFAARWYGDTNRQFLGDTNKSGIGVRVVNADNNAYSNDLIITSSKATADLNFEGEVYYIRDIDKVDRNRPLANTDSFFALFHTDSNFDQLGDDNGSGSSVIILDADRNGYANDLLLTSYRKDINVLGQADKNLVFESGAVFLVKDIASGTSSQGAFTFNFRTPGVDANVYGASGSIIVNATIFCRSTACGNVDTNLQYCIGNSCQPERFWDMNTVSSSPLYITSGSATQSQASMIKDQSYDVNWIITGAGDYNYELRLTSIGVTAIREYTNGLERTIVLEPSNSYDFGRRSSYYSRYFGSISNDAFGYAYAGNDSVQLVNVDNGVYANDIIATASFADANGKANNGAVYLIRNIDINQGELDVNSTYYFDLRIIGGAANDLLGGIALTTTGTASSGVTLANLDGNTYGNDLIIAAPNADTNGKTDNGAIYVFKDIDKKTGTRDLSSNTTTADLRITGNVASDKLGQSQHSGRGVQLTNLDGNVVSNDLIIVTPQADINGKVNNGAVYIIKDINTLSGSKDLNAPANYNTVFMGGIGSDQLGLGENGTDSVQLVNIDGNAWANDLIITTYVGDANGKLNTGAFYVIRDINLLTGQRDFNNTDNYNLRFSGGMTGDGLPQIGTPATGNDVNSWSLVNLDNNAWANDLLIASYATDFNGKTDVGALYVVRDINALPPGLYDFNNLDNFDMIITGSRASDTITQTNAGNSYQSGKAFELVNLDGEAYANDLYVMAARTDFLRTNGGSIYIFMNVDTNYGTKDLNQPTNYFARIDGSILSDGLGDTNGSGPAIQFVNWDGGAYTNDAILNVPFGDYNNRANAGVVYAITNLNQTSGIRDLNQTAGVWSTKWGGASAGDGIGDSNRSGYGVKIVNLDNEAVANDLLINASRGDFNTKSDNGGVYLILDANLASGDDPLSIASNYTTLWSGQSNFDFVGTAGQTGEGVSVVNLDNNANANDLIIVAPAADVSLKVNNGAVYIIQDANKVSGTLGLENKTNYTKRFVGRLAENNLGAAWFGTRSASPIDLDNNSYTNDMLFNSPYSDSNGKVNNGNITFVQNVLSVGAGAANDYSFVLMLPASTCSDGLGNQEGADGPCHRAWFQATDVIGFTDENQVNADGQSSSIPFLQYDNQSTTSSDLNILLDLNQSLPVTLILKVSKIFAGWAGTCTGNTDNNCALITTTATSVGRATYSAGTQDLNLYVWGDFNSATTGRVDRNVDSNSIAS